MTTQSLFDQSVVAAANVRGARGEEREIERLANEAIANGWGAPIPASIYSDLAVVAKKDGTEAVEVSPLQFAHAFYLVRTYGYKPRDARRIAKRFGMELDVIYTSDTAQVVRAITAMEEQFVDDKESVLIPTSIAAIKSRVATLKKRMKDGAVSDADLQQLASISEEIRDLSVATTPSLVVSA